MSHETPAARSGPISASAFPVHPVAEPRPVRSVYIHAPFCARRCVYCDFAVTVARAPRPGAWIEALRGEWRALEREGLFLDGEPLDTLYVGGGTPSLLGPHAMAALGSVLGRRRLAAADLEWTAEANPETFSPALASAWRTAGVNRVSLGVQSLDDTALRWMGRLHGAEGAERAVATARTAGITSVSVDLIFGLPPSLGRSWAQDLERALGLEPTHVSLYGLTVEGRTPLGRAVSEGREAPVDEAQYREEYLEAVERLGAAGFEHYEVSNFALTGHASRHNLAYWTGAPYLGLGNSAHSYRHPVRRWNLRDWAAYERIARRGELPVEGRETLSSEAHRLERIWLGLRMASGLESERLGPSARRLVEGWIREGLARPDAHRARLTPEGWLILDRLAVALDQAVSRD